MAKAKETDAFSPGHHTGKYYGYDVDADGSIRLAPSLSDKLGAILTRHLGLKTLLHATNEYASAEFAKLAAEEKRWWDEVLEDLGVPDKRYWLFKDGKLVKLPKDDAKTAGQE
jgi:hypothetical protein